MLTSFIISYFARLKWLTVIAESIVKEQIDYVLTNGTKGKIRVQNLWSFRRMQASKPEITKPVSIREIKLLHNLIL